MQGTIVDIIRTYQGKFRVTFEVDSVDELTGITGMVQIVIKRLTRKRSLNANAYFHVLCDKLRQKIGVSMAAMKNMLITSYGQIEYIDEGQALVYKTNAPLEYIQELEDAHLKFIKQGEDGAYWYKVYRGSHTYTVGEMSVLLEGTVAEAQAQGIETKSPDEIKRMEMLWNVKLQMKGDKK